MHFLSAILFGVSANIDNLTIGLVYGVRNVKIDRQSNLAIACISCTGTFLSMQLGTFVAGLINPTLANGIGCVILIFTGIWLVYGHFKRNRIQAAKSKEEQTFLCSAEDEQDTVEEPDTCGCLQEYISTKEVLALAIALTLNNLGLGLSASIAGLPIYLTSAFSFFFSLTLLSLGQMIGKSCLSQIFGKYAVFVSGLLLAILGLYELLI